MDERPAPPPPLPEPPAGRTLLSRLDWYAKHIADYSPGGLKHEHIAQLAALMVIADAIVGDVGATIEAEAIPPVGLLPAADGDERA